MVFDGKYCGFHGKTGAGFYLPRCDHPRYPLVVDGGAEAPAGCLSSAWGILIQAESFFFMDNPLDMPVWQISQNGITIEIDHCGDQEFRAHVFVPVNCFDDTVVDFSLCLGHLVDLISSLKKVKKVLRTIERERERYAPDIPEEYRKDSVLSQS